MKKDLKDKIFSKIEKEKIEPIPESYFENKNRNLRIGIVIFTILAIVFFGFLIDDSSEFMGMGRYGTGSFGYFLLPNIFWILLVSFLVFIGIKSLRNTTIGYRNSYTKDILIGIVIIFLGSYLFRFTGFGPTMHSYFIKSIPGVSSVLYNESSWNDPDNGRLAGTIQEINNDTIKLKSIDGTIWEIKTQDSFISPMVSIQVNEKIRILGIKKGTGTFESDRIMPRFGMGMGGGMGQGGIMNGGRGYGNGRGMMR